MSHFLCLVVLPEGSNMHHVEGQTSRMLAPYDENLEMPPREEPCWCTVTPAASCSECDGSGVRLSTSNPLAKWDWWAIGGRWDGWIFGPEREAASGDECQTLENNARPLREIPLDRVDGMPFAVITPNGQWHDAGDVVPGEWHRHVKELAGRYLDHLAVAVDCHT